MQSKKLIGVGLAIAAIAAYRIWNTKESLKFLQYNMSGVKFNFKNPLKPELIFAIEIFNPNRAGIPITDFFGVIKQSNTIIANFRNLQQVTLAGNQNHTIEVVARVNAINTVLSILRNKNLKFVTIEAMLKTGFFDMPIKKTINVLEGIGNIQSANFNRMHRIKRRSFLNRSFSTNSFLQYGNFINRPLVGSMI